MKITENTTSVNGESAAVQSATAGPNDPTETHATKTENPTAVAPQTGGVSSPVLCSAGFGVSDKQDFKESCKPVTFISLSDNYKIVLEPTDYQYAKSIVESMMISWNLDPSQDFSDFTHRRELGKSFESQILV